MAGSKRFESRPVFRGVSRRIGIGLTIALRDWPDAAVIGLVIVVDAALGASQEVRSGRALAALAALTAPRGRVIRDGVTGTLFPAGDPPAIAAALARLLADRSGWEARRDAARAFVEGERNWSTNVARYAPVYQALTGKAA